MVDQFIAFINWIFDTFNMIVSGGQRLFTWLANSISKIIFSSASWCKHQLDKQINTDQRQKLNTIINESETEEGRRFDTFMIWIILLSVCAVIMESITEVRTTYWWVFFFIEWGFTIIFTIEYILRLYSSKNPIKYATSFFGIVDLLAIIPAYLGLIFINAQNLTVVRALRLLRIFRIFKMGHFVKEGSIIVEALKSSKVKIYVFISFILLISILIGSLLHLVEGRVNPDFDNIPKGIYWAIVTLTTVGYGDIVPITPFGRICATAIMIMGYGVIAVPTGIVTAEISIKVRELMYDSRIKCRRCYNTKHHPNADYCHACGEQLTF